MLSFRSLHRWIVLSALSVGCLLAAEPPAAGPLAWEVTERHFTPNLGQEVIAATFPFRNASDRPVRITSINPGCVCTTATLAKDTYAPGEQGELKVEFTLGERVGRQERLIHLTTDDPAAALATVKLVVEIPEFATVLPRLLFWKIGEAPGTKTAGILLTQPETSQLGAPKSTNSTFAAQLTLTAKPGVYRLEITPSKTTETAHGVIHVPATIQGKSRTLSVFVAVK